MILSGRSDDAELPDFGASSVLVILQFLNV